MFKLKVSNPEKISWLTDNGEHFACNHKFCTVPYVQHQIKWFIVLKTYMQSNRIRNSLLILAAKNLKIWKLVDDMSAAGW